MTGGEEGKGFWYDDGALVQRASAIPPGKFRVIAG